MYPPPGSAHWHWLEQQRLMAQLHYQHQQRLLLQRALSAAALQKVIPPADETLPARPGISEPPVRVLRRTIRFTEHSKPPVASSVGIRNVYAYTLAPHIDAGHALFARLAVARHSKMGWVGVDLTPEPTSLRSGVGKIFFDSVAKPGQLRRIAPPAGMALVVSMAPSWCSVNAYVASTGKARLLWSHENDSTVSMPSIEQCMSRFLQEARASGL